MSLSKSKYWYSNNCLHFLKCAVPFNISCIHSYDTFSVVPSVTNSNLKNIVSFQREGKFGQEVNCTINKLWSQLTLLASSVSDAPNCGFTYDCHSDDIYAPRVANYAVGLWQVAVVYILFSPSFRLPGCAGAIQGKEGGIQVLAGLAPSSQTVETNKRVIHEQAKRS